MYKIYFKQAIQTLKQNKFIGAITITGTTLSIMMIMVIIVTYSVKNANIAPEINRDRTLYLRWQTMDRKDKTNMRNSYITYDNYKNYLSNLKDAEFSSAILLNTKESEISANDDSEELSLTLKSVDANYWKLMSFSFLEGQPFNQADFDSGIKKAVINKSTARHLFGNNTNVTGKTFGINFKTYTVVGMVEDVSPVLSFANADVYMPYSTIDNYEECIYTVLILAKNKKEALATIEEEVRDAERKYNVTDNDWSLTFQGPYNHEAQQISVTNQKPDIEANTYKMVFIFLVLLIIPAINLSGVSVSRIMKRTEEIGIRKAFGAKRHVILIQILYENFITTLIGGIIGLILSYIVVIRLKKWLLGIDADSVIPLEALVSVPVFLSVFVVCLLLNFLSTGIPAYKASRMKVVDSLNRTI